jgi:YbbR domain-containing protein
VEKKISKKLDVSVEYQGAVPEGYLTDEANIQLSTNSVSVSGPQSILSTITGAKIKIDLSNRTETISATYPFVLVDSDGNAVTSSAVTTDVNTIHVNLKISQFKQVSVKFDVLYNGGATPQNTSVIPSVDSIQIVGHKNLLADINEIHLGTIDLSQYPANITQRFPVDLPDGVSGISFVDVAIQFTGLETKTLQVSKFVPVNVPHGMHVTFQQKPLNITIRGTKAELESITEDNIVAEVDFSITREGASSMPVKIVINTDKPTNAGAIKSYTVDANMQRA